MVSSGRGRLYRRKDRKYLIYVPVDLAEDSQFPWRGQNIVYVKISFKPKGPKQLIIEPYKEPVEPEV